MLVFERRLVGRHVVLLLETRPFQRRLRRCNGGRMPGRAMLLHGIIMAVDVYHHHVTSACGYYDACIIRHLGCHRHHQLHHDYKFLLLRRRQAETGMVLLAALVVGSVRFSFSRSTEERRHAVFLHQTQSRRTTTTIQTHESIKQMNKEKDLDSGHHHKSDNNSVEKVSSRRFLIS
jgi:hypothetical protein